jgi:O-antigen ligase
MTLIYYLAVLISIVFFIKSLSNLKEGLLIGLIFSTYSLGALPWHLLPIEGIAFGVQLLFIFLTVIYFLTLSKKYSYYFVFTKYHYYLITVTFLLLFYLLFNQSSSLVNGIDKTTIFILKNVLPIFTISLFAPFTKKDIKIIFYTLLAGAILSILAIFSITDAEMNRTVDYPLVMARRIGLGVSLLVALMINSNMIKKKFKLVILITIFAGIVAMLFTGSRGPIIAVLAVALVNLIILEGSLTRKIGIFFRRTFFIFAIFLIFIPLIGYFDEFKSVNRVLGYFQNTNDLSSRSDEMRNDFYIIAWEGFIDTKGFGVGTGGFEDLSIKNGYINENGDAGVLYPHNIFLEFASEQGVIGLVIIIFIVIRSWIKMMHTLKNSSLDYYSKSLASLWIFGFINALVSGSIASNLLWITLILLWSPQKNSNE